jgi:hypothetical protein
MTLEKIKWMWDEMNHYRSLFSDLTKGSAENFYNVLMLPDSFWLEVVDKDDKMVGVVYWTGMGQVIDCDVHIVFFDRKPTEKIPLCKEIAKWFFTAFPSYNRMTATLPEFYHATIRIACRIGFKREGKKRQSQLMGGKYVDEIVFGLLASEVG